MVEKFCKRLIEERKGAKITQVEMASMLGISQPSYIRYENGTSEPNLTNLIKLSEILDVSVDYLLGKNDI